MRELLLSLALLGAIKYLIEEGLHSTLLVRCLHALAYVLAIAVAQLLTQEVSRGDIEAALYTPEALSNISLLVMLDLLYVVYKCTNRPQSIRSWRTWMRHLPPLLFFPCLFYIRLSLFYYLPGYSFLGVSIAMAMVVGTASIVAPQLWRLLGMDRASLREPLVLLSLASFLLVVAAGVLHPDSAVQGVATHTDYWQTLWLLLGLLAMALIGYSLPRVWQRIQSCSLARRERKQEQ